MCICKSSTHKLKVSSKVSHSEVTYKGRASRSFQHLALAPALSVPTFSGHLLSPALVSKCWQRQALHGETQSCCCASPCKAQLSWALSQIFSLTISLLTLKQLEKVEYKEFFCFRETNHLFKKSNEVSSRAHLPPFKQQAATR